MKKQKPDVRLRGKDRTQTAQSAVARLEIEPLGLVADSEHKVLNSLAATVNPIAQFQGLVIEFRGE